MLHTSFSTHGLPEVIVSDNSTAFTSGQFKEFREQNVTSVIYHPSSNGLVEKIVETFKNSFDKMKEGG